ncbi:MAG TPA: hypothetical protein ENI95_01900, partial [Chloroflexi bacterium]|nr:hypothetical protein [Chloroflexota bacterium]
MSRDSERQPPATAPHEPPRTGTPITVGDVLRAVFMPPQEDVADSPAWAGFSLPRPWHVPPDEGTEPAPFDPSAWMEPTAIEYEEGVIKPVEEISPARAAALGVGTLVALLMGYMAQASLTNRHDGFTGGLLYGLAVLVWLGLLMFEIAPPDGG